MDIMQWFRKRSKKFLIWFGCALMIGFLLPNLAGRSNRQRQDQVVGHYTDAQGKQQEISTQMLYGAARQLEILASFGMDRLSHPQIGVLRNVADLGGISLMAELAPFQLFFNDGPMSRNVRGSLMQQITQAGWATSAAEVLTLQKDVIDLTTVNRSDASRMFLLLLQEANEAGFRASAEQVETLLQVRSQLAAGGQLPLPPVAAVVKRLNITETDLKQAIGNYLAIAQYGDAVTSGLVLSEQEIKESIRRELEMENIAGNYVTFSSNLFLDQVAEPGEDELQSHFDTYKSVVEGQADNEEENPLGFGYKLADRVQVETLRIDLGKVQKNIEDEFTLKPLAQQEDEVQAYWATHREEFTELLPADPADESAQAETRQKEFDEVVTEARAGLIQSLALQKAQKLLSQAYKATTKIKDQSLSDVDLEKVKSEYADIAARLSRPDIQIDHGQSDYLTIQTAQQYLNFSQTFTAPRGVQEINLLSILFNAQALKDADDLISPDLAPVKLYESIENLLTFDRRQNATFAVLARVVSVDQDRAPVSMTDDGTQGAFNSDATASENNALHARIKSDVERLRAFELTKAQAETFAADATADWTLAFEQTNRSLTVADPNDPNKLGPLRQTTLQSNRDQLRQLQQFASQQQGQASSYFRQAIVRQATHLLEVTKVAQQRRDAGSVLGLAMVELPSELSVLVFEDLVLTAATENQYVQRRAGVTAQLLERKQPAILLTHYNPNNIDQRHHFEFVEREEEEPESQE